MIKSHYNCNILFTDEIRIFKNKNNLLFTNTIVIMSIKQLTVSCLVM